MRRRLGSVLAAGLLVSVFVVPVSAAERSAACASIDGTTGPSGSLYPQTWGPQDVLRITASDPIGSPMVVTASVFIPSRGYIVVESAPFPGPLTMWPEPYSIYGGLLLDVDQGSATLSIECATWEEFDTDLDGIDDDLDRCLGTVLPDTFPELKADRYAADMTGTFRSGRSAGTWTLAQTAGCSAQQIIASAGLGKGHQKYGLSQEALEAWVASVSTP